MNGVIRGGFTMLVDYEVVGDTPEGEKVFDWCKTERQALTRAEEIKDNVMSGRLDAWNIRVQPLSNR